MQKALIRKSRRALIPRNLSNLRLYTNTPERRGEARNSSQVCPATLGKGGEYIWRCFDLGFHTTYLLQREAQAYSFRPRD